MWKRKILKHLGENIGGYLYDSELGENLKQDTESRNHKGKEW